MEELNIALCKIVDIKGVDNWRIYQQKAGKADIPISGKLTGQAIALRKFQVCFRLLREDTYNPVTNACNWTLADSYDSRTGEFSHTLKDIPAGGLYRLEIGIRNNQQKLGSSRFMMAIHSLGVGDLWVLAGQSNSAGYGRGMAEDGPELGVHVLKNNESWELAMHPLNDPTGSGHPNREGNPMHSPMLAFGKILKHRLGYPIGLIQTALGGSPLNSWLPDGVLYRNMLHCIKLAGGKVTGMIWYQGCSDTTEQLAPTYFERFMKFLENTRKDTGTANLPVITTQLNIVASENIVVGCNEGWSIVREAQRQVALQAENVAVVPALGLPLADPIHNSVAGNLELGGKYADTALGMVYGKKSQWKYPDIEQILITGEKNLELHYRNVYSSLITIPQHFSNFIFKDDDGNLAVTDFSVPEQNVVKITLDRKPGKDFTVSSGYGKSPEANLYDIEYHRPALVFHNVKPVPGD